MPISRAALTVQLLNNREAIAAIGAEWDALSHRGASGVSATSVWYDVWSDVFARTQASRVIAVTDETGALRGVLPLTERSRTIGGLRVRVLEMAGESVACGDHLGLVSNAPDDDVWRAALPLLHTLGRDVDVVDLRSLTAMTAPGRFLGSLAPTGWRAAPATGSVAPRLALNGSAAAFEQSLSANRRQQLRRRQRALDEAHPGHAFVCNDERVSIDSALDDLERLHQLLWSSRGVAGAFADPLFGAFVRRFARAAHTRGWLRLHQLVVEGETVASLLAYHWEGVGSYYTSGWNPAYAEWHVGELLLAHVIRTAAEAGLSSFDLGRGADAYKSRFAADPVPLLAATWSTSARGQLAVSAHQLALRVQREWNRWRTRVSRVFAMRRRTTGVPSR